MNYPSLLNKVQAYATSAFEHRPLSELLYHNRQHTESVASYAAQIAAHYKLEERDYFVVVASAWLHDLGYAVERTNHEQKGAEAAATFLESLDVPAPEIEAIKNCILATKIPQRPHNLLEEIVCDADLFHIGTKQFSEKINWSAKNGKT